MREEAAGICPGDSVGQLGLHCAAGTSDPQFVPQGAETIGRAEAYGPIPCSLSLHSEAKGEGGVPLRDWWVSEAEGK